MSPIGERAQRVLAVVRHVRPPVTAREVAAALGESPHTVRHDLCWLSRAGLVEHVPSPPGSHYPIAGWRAVGGA